jgi:heme a synthase
LRRAAALRQAEERSLSPIATPYNPAHHRFAVFLAACTFLLIIAGALVTSNDAGLAVPDWPTSFGSLVRIPPMVGGVLYEHGHRMMAQFVGLLTIILAVWTQRVEQRSWMRKLGWAALAAVIFQGILGGITVLTFLPWYISSLHAFGAQTFFALTVLIALFTSRGWVETGPRQVMSSGVLRLPSLAMLVVAALYVQLLTGAAFRHGGVSFLPHVVSAVVVTAILLWATTRVLTQHSNVSELRRPATVLLVLLVVQLGLGFVAYLTRIEWSREAAQPMAGMVWSTVAHVATGALLMATSFVLAAQAHRHAAVEAPIHPRQKAVTA